MGFPGGLAGKESTCSVGDLGLIPGLGRSPGEGNGYPLQYSGLENSVDCIDGNPLQCSCLENPRDGGAWWAAVSGVAQSRTRLKRLSSIVHGVSKSLTQLSDFHLTIGIIHSPLCKPWLLTKLITPEAPILPRLQGLETVCDECVP